MRLDLEGERDKTARRRRIIIIHMDGSSVKGHQTKHFDRDRSTGGIIPTNMLKDIATEVGVEYDFGFDMAMVTTFGPSLGKFEDRRWIETTKP